MADTKGTYGELNVSQGTADFFQGSTDFGKNLQLLKDQLREFFNLKNVNFLLGSGTSAGAIPTMKKLYESLSFDEKEGDIEAVFNDIKSKAESNLEQCLNIMYSARTYYSGLDGNTEDEKAQIKKKQSLYDKLIKKVEAHIFNSINISFEKDEEVVVKALERYKTFYQKLALRNKDNSRIRVFTTNNDLFNEMALDTLNIHYINGFSGGLHRYFNPAIFNYTWSKRMDTSIDKYEPVENLVYLYKIHGSVNWRESDTLMNNYFEIEEVNLSSNSKSDKAALIYPTPTKQDKSLGSPYVDLFREFQNKLLEPHSVLFVIGYSFSDRHVNDVIYRALATNSTINVVIFGEKPPIEERQKKPIFFINDSRIFTINGKTFKDKELKDTMETINHFDYIVDQLIPNIDAFRKEDELLNKFICNLKSEINCNENRQDNIS